MVISVRFVNIYILSKGVKKMTTVSLFCLVVFLGVFGVVAILFLLTRMTVVMDHLFPARHTNKSHVYLLYTNMSLIKLFDWQPFISSVLLFQYGKLVDIIVNEINQTVLKHKKVLFTSCAFGNVIPRVATAVLERGAKQITVTDIIENELVNAKSKVANAGDRVRFVENDATCLNQSDESVDLNVIFFLLHELTHDAKLKVLCEVNRVLKPGGKFILVEFHYPNRWVMRALSFLYFTVFEPYGLALWHTHDPAKILGEIGEYTIEKHTRFFGNYQVIVATKNK